MHRCTSAHSDAPTREKRKIEERGGRKRRKEREREATEERARQDGEQQGSLSLGEGSVVLVSLSLTLGSRDKPLLMEEINFGLNRSPATL